MPIDNKIIDDIKSRVDVVDVISDFVSLKKSGQSYKALSPFTNEKTPSFYVSPAKGIYKCFSSGKGGDAINFIMEYEGLNYIEAIKYLGKKYGIEVEEEELSEDQIQAQNERDALFIVLAFANDFYQDVLWEKEEGKNIGLAYLRERGYPDEIIKKFELGHSLEAWDALTVAAGEKGYSQDLLEKAGLLIKKESKQYDRFRGRVIFPIHNLTGKVIAFGARTLKKDKKSPKYINSPETDIYNKSNTLYGLHLAKRAIRDQERCYLVEGYTDVISLHQAGIENVVSSSGTSLTEDQIKLIRRYSDNVTMLFDGDEAGIKASLRGVDMLLQGGLNVKLVIFPDGQDPDSYAKELGNNEFKIFLEENARDFISFKIELYAKEASEDPVKKAETIKEIVSSITKIPDPVKRAVYVKETSKLLEIDESILIAEQNKILITDRRQKRRLAERQEAIMPIDDIVNEQEKVKESDPDALVAFQEKECIRLLLNYGLKEMEEDYRLSDYLLNELEEIEFVTPAYREILDTYKQELSKGNIIDSNYFVEKGTEQVKREVIDLITNKHELSENWSKHSIFVPSPEDVLDNMVYVTVLRLKYNLVKKLITENVEKLKTAQGDAEEQKLQQIHTKLKESEVEIGKSLGIVVNS